MSIEEQTEIGRCTAALGVAGEVFRCDLSADHTGWPHSNTAARAIWSGGGVTDAKSLPDGAGK